MLKVNDEHAVITVWSYSLWNCVTLVLKLQLCCTRFIVLFV